MILAKENDSTIFPKYYWSNGKLQRKGKLVVGQDNSMKQELLLHFHASSSTGHSGVYTVKRLAAVVYWKGMWKDVREFVRTCSTCQCYKPENRPTLGLLQPLPMPAGVFTNITMDFIGGLPKSGGKSAIMVVVDHLTKYGNFMLLPHPYSAKTVAQLFLDHVYKLHGLPNTITSDKDSVFTSSFWKEFFKLQGMELQFSTAYHP